LLVPDSTIHRWDAQLSRPLYTDKVNFTKNLALIGGAAFAAATRDRWP